MHERGADARLAAALAEALEVRRVVVGEAPRARALHEELHGVGADLLGPVERAFLTPPEQWAPNSTPVT